MPLESKIYVQAAQLKSEQPVSAEFTLDYQSDTESQKSNTDGTSQWFGWCLNFITGSVPGNSPEITVDDTKKLVNVVLSNYEETSMTDLWSCMNKATKGIWTATNGPISAFNPAGFQITNIGQIAFVPTNTE
jgi:hypothetical protein